MLDNTTAGRQTDANFTSKLDSTVTEMKADLKGLEDIAVNGEVPMYDEQGHLKRRMGGQGGFGEWKEGEHGDY